MPRFTPLFVFAVFVSTSLFVGLFAGQPADEKHRGLHNVLRVMDGLYSGSSPEGDAGFQSLKKLGIKTIITVDGARPDIELAHKYGMKYVHLPIGYNTIRRPQGLRMAKAVLELPGAVYMHCHHGQHRGPAAAAFVRLCLDKHCSVADAIAILKKAGTSPSYAGLFKAVRELDRPTRNELARLQAEFPEVSTVSDLTQAMVAIDHRFDNLKVIRSAGWKIPRDHPDLVPALEARQLVEHYHDLAKLMMTQKRPADFRAWVSEGEQTARNLESTLRMGKTQQAEALFQASSKICSQCHKKYRN